MCRTTVSWYCVPLQRSPQWITYAQWPITSQEALMSHCHSGILCKCHHRLQSLEEWGLSLFSQSNLIPWSHFYTRKDTMIDHFKKSSSKKEISSSLFSSLVASGKISGLIANSTGASSVHHHYPEIITHFLWTFFISFLMSSHSDNNLLCSWPDCELFKVWYCIVFIFSSLYQEHRSETIKGQLKSDEEVAMDWMFLSPQNSHPEILTPMWC